MTKEDQLLNLIEVIGTYNDINKIYIDENDTTLKQYKDKLEQFISLSYIDVIKSLNEVIESQKQTFNALLNKYKQLEQLSIFKN